MAIEIDGGWEKLPFDEAIAWFRRKVNIPTERWNDLTSEAHERAFTVAGATSIQVLAALRAAVDKSLANGTSLQEFRKDFDRIVAETGWSYRGNRTWRTELILNQNIRNAYGRGRFLQLTDPDTMKARPIWQWRHGDSIQPRPLHLEWNGVTLPAGHPWFMARIPPAGFGCKCKIISLSRGAKLTPPPKETYETYTYPNGVTVKLPAGVDPGFEHVPDRDTLEKEVLKSLRRLNIEEQQSAFERLGLVDSPRYVPEEITDSFMRRAIGAVLNSDETNTIPEALARRLQENKAFNIGQAVVTQWGLEDMGPVWEYAQLVVSGGLVTEVSKSIQKEFQKTVARHIINVFGEDVIKDMRSNIKKIQKGKQRTYCFSGLPIGSGLGAEEIVEKLKGFGLEGEVLAFSTTGGLGKSFSGGGVLRALFKMNYFIQTATHNIIADWLELGPVDKLNLVG
ncbi:MAG: phage minor head protein, partial [Nanopusillaceae archaeon]